VLAIQTEDETNRAKRVERTLYATRNDNLGIRIGIRIDLKLHQDRDDEGGTRGIKGIR